MAIDRLLSLAGSSRLRKLNKVSHCWSWPFRLFLHPFCFSLFFSVLFPVLFRCLNSPLISDPILPSVCYPATVFDPRCVTLAPRSSSTSLVYIACTLPVFRASSSLSPSSRRSSVFFPLEISFLKCLTPFLFLTLFASAWSLCVCSLRWLISCVPNLIPVKIFLPLYLYLSCIWVLYLVCQILSCAGPGMTRTFTQELASG